MKIINEVLNFREFAAWSGAVDTQEKIVEAGLDDEFENLIEELYPDGLTDTQLNDILWFDDEWVFKSLGIWTDEGEEPSSPHGDECECIECNTCFHCGKELGKGNNDCSHCMNEDEGKPSSSFRDQCLSNFMSKDLKLTWEQRLDLLVWGVTPYILKGGDLE